ncbi:MAG: polysaccharide deacetylase family protein [Cyclobacteriaceae bacterium]
MYWHRTPRWLTWLYPELIWHKNREEKKLYITFDDGPVPEVTPWVLDTLDNYNAKATFFCVGENIQKNPALFKELSNRGHMVGNHTHTHINGWKTNATDYLENVDQCQSQMQTCIESKGTKPLMRPPYGRIKQAQIRQLTPKFQIIMWDVLSGDFDQSKKPEACLNASINATQSGSIVIFHDSLKAQQNLAYILPRFLNHFATQGFAFPVL